jgi:hypothetical protein
MQADGLEPSNGRALDFRHVLCWFSEATCTCVRTDVPVDHQLMGVPGLCLVCDEKDIVHVNVLACRARACTRVLAWLLVDAGREFMAR